MNIDNSEPWNCLDFKVNTDDIAASGKSISLKVDNEAHKTLLQSLDLLDLEFRRCDFSISSLAADCFKVKTQLDCIVQQKCSITLETVETRIKQTFTTEFWPSHKLKKYFEEEKDQEPSLDIEDTNDFEEIEDDYINLGRYIFEVLSTTIDPYPKKEGAVLDWKNNSDDETDASNKPFASLKALKNGHNE